jgi:hypothetical protein
MELHEWRKPEHGECEVCGFHHPEDWDHNLQGLVAHIKTLESALQPLSNAFLDEPKSSMFEGHRRDLEIDCCVTITYAEVEAARDLVKPMRCISCMKPFRPDDGDPTCWDCRSIRDGEE